MHDLKVYAIYFFKDAINKAMPRTTNNIISETVHFILVHLPEHPRILKKQRLWQFR